MLPNTNLRLITKHKRAVGNEGARSKYSSTVGFAEVESVKIKRILNCWTLWKVVGVISKLLLREQTDSTTETSSEERSEAAGLFPIPQRIALSKKTRYVHNPNYF